MSRRRPNADPYRPSNPELALQELCVKFGYCIPPDDQDAILNALPANADAFVDAVILAEGLNPTAMTKEDRRPMVEVVARLVYRDSEDT